MTPYIALWAALATIVLVLAIWRQIIDHKEDDSIHLHAHEDKVVQQQAAMARKIGSIDRWGKVLTIATVVYGLCIAGNYLYQQWIESTKLP